MLLQNTIYLYLFIYKTTVVELEILRNYILHKERLTNFSEIIVRFCKEKPLHLDDPNNKCGTYS